MMPFNGNAKAAMLVSLVIVMSRFTDRLTDTQKAIGVIGAVAIAAFGGGITAASLYSEAVEIPARVKVIADSVHIVAERQEKISVRLDSLRSDFTEFTTTNDRKFYALAYELYLVRRGQCLVFHESGIQSSDCPPDPDWWELQPQTGGR